MITLIFFFYPSCTENEVGIFYYLENETEEIPEEIPNITVNMTGNETMDQNETGFIPGIPAPEDIDQLVQFMQHLWQKLVDNFFYYTPPAVIFVFMLVVVIVWRRKKREIWRKRLGME